MRKLAFFLAAAVLLPGGVPPDKFYRAGKIRALIISGQNNHDWRTTTPFLRNILEQTGKFDTRVVEEPAGLTSETLSKFQVIITDYNGPRWGATAENAVSQFVAGGGGFVVYHGASYAFGDQIILADKHVRTGLTEPPWPEYAKMVGAVWATDPKTGHGPRHTFPVKWVDTASPIAAGLPPTFLVDDELYQNFKFIPGVKVNVLATAFADTNMGGTGKDEPLLWTVDYGKGRVFQTALGHDIAALQMPGFVTSFARGVEWAATGSVTIPADFALDRTQKDAIRTLLVTGGHDHETSLYAIFDPYPDLRVTVDPHPEGFRKDIDKRYDVLVLYDMVPTVTDAQKENLKRFAESGKGIVVLHHAIANFSDWEWWWKDLVGGKYLLKPEMGMAASTYKHDTEFVAEPVGKHPVTQGLPIMRMYDETYHGMWISPEVKVLLKTSEPTSDGPLVWISPYQKSRVVYIELGHGREAHINPNYRTLVHNAILWAAGRTN